MCLTYALQFFVPIQIIMPFINKKCGTFIGPIALELIFRTIVVLATCMYTNEQRIDVLV